MRPRWPAAGCASAFDANGDAGRRRRAPVPRARGRARLRTPPRIAIRLCFIEGHPFPRGLLAWWSEAGLLAPGPISRAFPAAARRPVAVVRLTSPVTVAGPRRIRTGFPWPPTLNARSYRAHRGIVAVGTQTASDDRQPHPHLHPPRRRRRDPPRRHEPGGQDPSRGSRPTGPSTSSTPRSAWRSPSTVCPSATATGCGHIQNDLFDVGADIAAPEDRATRERLRVLPEQTTWLEERCDEVNADAGAAEVLRPARRDRAGGASARLPHRVPARGARRHRLRRRRQRRGRSATSTASRTCCSSSAAAPTTATSRSWEPGRFRR